MRFPGAGLVRSFASLLVGTVVYSAAQFGLIVALSRLRGLEAVGDYGLAQAVAAPVFMVLHLQMRRLLATDVGRDYSFQDYFVLQFVTGLAGMLVVSAIAGLWFSNRVTLFVAVALFKWLEFLAEVVYGALQRADRLGVIALSMVARGICGLILMVAVVAQGGALATAVGAACLASLTVLLVYDLRQTAAVGEALRPVRLSLRRLWDLAALGFPTGLNMGCVALSTGLPRYFLDAHAGARAVGALVSLFQFIQLGTLLNQTMINTAISRLSRAYRASGAQFVRFLATFCGLSAALGVGLILLVLVAGDRLLEWLFTETAAAYAPELTILMLAGAARYVQGAMSAACMGMRLLRQEAMVQAVTLVVTGVSCAVLIPGGAVHGAVWAMVIAAFVGAALTGSLVILRLRSRLSHA